MSVQKKIVSHFRGWNHRRQFRKASILTEAEGNRCIRQKIESETPFMVSRFSTCEINVLNIYRLRQRFGLSKQFSHLLTGVPVDYTDKVRFQARNNAGIFPETHEGLDRFAQVTLEACEQIDLLGVWSRRLKLEETLYRERCPSATLIPLHAIDSYDQLEPWTAALCGKKVLVIHPFEASIQKQYLKRELLFPGTEVLPEFDLNTIRAVQSAAGSSVEFESWVEALSSMKAQIDAVDFDVALIGAGAYGLPLAAHVKEFGKQAVHMGGALQLLFGIKGARWDARPEVCRFYNEHWVRPLPEETPVQSEQVEEGCYW